MTIVAGSTTWTQKHARFRNDDGSETTATFKAAVDTNISLVAASIFRLRLAISQLNSGCLDSTSAFQLKYQKNGGGYVQVTTATTDVFITTSANITDGTATTQQISSPDTFTAGNLVVNDNLTSSTAVHLGSTVEFEWQLQLGALSVGDTIDFQFFPTVTTNTSEVYTVTPRITIVAASAAGGNFFLLF